MTEPGTGRPGRRIVPVLLAVLAAGPPLAGCTRTGPPARSPASTPATATAGATPSGGPPGTAGTGPGGAGVPRPRHVVVVVEENHGYDQVVGHAPYLDSLAVAGADFTASYGVARPSEPNYLALFSGSTHGLTDDSCPHTYSSTNLGAQLAAAGLTFTGYSESMPSPGYTGCGAGGYARKHNPWVNFTNVAASTNQPFSAFPTDYARLPTVSFVVPDLCHDMHDCAVATGDRWLRANLDAYRRWAMDNDSLLVVTFDEGEGGGDNRIPTIFVGPMVRAGTVATRIDHYAVLRTIQDMYGLPCAAASCPARPITGIWH